MGIRYTIAAMLLLKEAATSSAFILPRNSPIMFQRCSNQPMTSSAFFRQKKVSVVNMASGNVDDEVEALRAAAAKAREDAAKLSKEMGKDIESETETKQPTTITKKSLSTTELSELTQSIDFDSGDAESQSTKLDSLVKNGSLSLWKSAVTGTANTSFQTPLRPYPVSLNFLESRTDGKITADSLGVGGEVDVNLNDFKDATLVVTGVSTALAIGSLAFLPPNIGATFCYFFALVPIVFLGIGSSSPGIIAGAIASMKGTKDDASERDERICRHEAAHFLCGYLCGLPVKSYVITEETGFPCVEFHVSSESSAITTQRELSREEVAALSVVAMSGSVAEVLKFGVAKGGENDLIALQGFFRRSEEFLGSQKQQDLTRWGALVAYNLVKANREVYEKLVGAFQEKKSVAECVAIIEGSS